MEPAITAAASVHAPRTNTHENPTIEPVTWLKAFEALGGGYAIGEHSLRLCIMLGNQTDAELMQARMMVRALTVEDRATIYSHLRSTGPAQIGEA